MTNARTWILTLLFSRFWMATLLVPVFIVFIFLNLFGLLEYLVIWLTSKFYRRHYELISKYDTGLKTLLLQGPPESELYGDLVVPVLVSLFVALWFILLGDLF